MVRTYTLLTCAAGTSERVCRELSAVDGVDGAHVVVGEFDVILELEGPDVQSLLRLVSVEIRPREGVGTTRTYVCLD
ncbi:Lrp/AsnC ligand binding domain-containing protein [Halostagnicola sp. A-GB9-2]|uniref:Lrp/AsnC ligand binding domain-containing protein n=1 Tax=Halostagnicola sp. A-GB9-2 TaxID=3048066 RepID=UPI0024C01037|nr:Lrp/AsnC ligand binding domain-containing protein [Halostagnicola sp. A-GB9-2]MDJ1433058.1 Lrp/AsnC ligand binding domain-containing protein [Halostagnicola sp. A-GB9-2]